MKNVLIIYSLLFLSTSYSQVGNDTMITIIHVYKSAYSISKSKTNKYGAERLYQEVHPLYLIDTVKLDHHQIFHHPSFKSLTYNDGDFFILYHRKRPLYSFCNDVKKYKKKDVSKLLSDNEFKRKLILFGINLDEIDPNRVINFKL